MGEVWRWSRVLWLSCGDDKAKRGGREFQLALLRFRLDVLRGRIGMNEQVTEIWRSACSGKSRAEHRQLYHAAMCDEALVARLFDAVATSQ